MVTWSHPIQINHEPKKRLRKIAFPQPLPGYELKNVQTCELSPKLENFSRALTPLCLGVLHYFQQSDFASDVAR